MTTTTKVQRTSTTTTATTMTTTTITTKATLTTKLGINENLWLILIVRHYDITA
ncbi:unnamed protein product, partial [Nesidiocoris tenuis]